MSKVDFTKPTDLQNIPEAQDFYNRDWFYYQNLATFEPTFATATGHLKLGLAYNGSTKILDNFEIKKTFDSGNSLKIKTANENLIFHVDNGLLVTGANTQHGFFKMKFGRSKFDFRGAMLGIINREDFDRHNVFKVDIDPETQKSTFSYQSGYLMSRKGFRWFSYLHAKIGDNYSHIEAASSLAYTVTAKTDLYVTSKKEFGTGNKSYDIGMYHKRSQNDTYFANLHLKDEPFLYLGYAWKRGDYIQGKLKIEDLTKMDLSVKAKICPKNHLSFGVLHDWAVFGNFKWGFKLEVEN